MTIYEKAVAMQQILEKENRRLQKQIDEAPPGKIYCSRDNARGRVRWEVIEDGKCTYLPFAKRELAMQLAEKRLNVRKLSDNRQELKAIRAYLWHHHEGPSGTEKLLQKSPVLTSLIGSLNAGKEWMEKPYKKNPVFPEYLSISAPDGQTVRSKSEAEIITVLIELGIPYRYECAVIEDGKIYYPDFTLWLPEYNVIKYWEHLGKIDDPSYRKEAFHKISWYIDHGIVPQENLILSYETKDRPFTIVKARNIAKYYLT